MKRDYLGESYQILQRSKNGGKGGNASVLPLIPVLSELAILPRVGEQSNQTCCDEKRKR
jgi:hypothetical protein